MVSHWTYDSHEAYGSPKVGEQKEEVSNLRKAANGLSMEFDVPLVPERVYSIQISDPSGRTLSVQRGYYTLNRLVK